MIKIPTQNHLYSEARLALTVSWQSEHVASLEPSGHLNHFHTQLPRLPIVAQSVELCFFHAYSTLKPPNPQASIILARNNNVTPSLSFPRSPTLSSVDRLNFAPLGGPPTAFGSPAEDLLPDFHGEQMKTGWWKLCKMKESVTGANKLLVRTTNDPSPRRQSACFDKILR